MNRRAKSPELRPFCQKVELEESHLQLQDYKAICRDILRNRNRLDSDLRHGKYEKRSRRIRDIDHVAIAEHSVFIHFYQDEYSGFEQDIP